MRDIDELFERLGQSKFRSQLHLSKKDAQYLKDKGMGTILEHARQFILTRLANAQPANDGKQTPMKNLKMMKRQNRKPWNRVTGDRWRISGL